MKKAIPVSRGTRINLSSIADNKAGPAMVWLMSDASRMNAAERMEMGGGAGCLNRGKTMPDSDNFSRGLLCNRWVGEKLVFVISRPIPGFTGVQTVEQTALKMNIA